MKHALSLFLLLVLFSLLPSCSRPASEPAPLSTPAIAEAAPVSHVPVTDRAAIQGDIERSRKLAQMFLYFQRDFRGVANVAADEVKMWMDAGDTILVDVREPEEQAVAILPGALSETEFAANKSNYRGKRIVAYCTNGYRGGCYAKRLKADGFDASNLSMGLLGWLHAGLPVVQNGQNTNRVHVYGETWDLAPAGYETTW